MPAHAKRSESRPATPAGRGAGSTGGRRTRRRAGVAAFFDFDGTLLDGYSVFAFLLAKLLGGRMPAAELGATLTGIAAHALGRIRLEDLIAEGARHARGLREEDYVRLGQRAFDAYLARRLYPEARALIRAHRSRGHTVAIVTSATPYQVAPAARLLGVDHVLCTRFEVRRGRFTGALAAPACAGADKRVAAEGLADQLGLDLARSYFYTDAHDDLPLLDGVGHPSPVNPDRALQAVALARNWPVRRFAARKATRPVDYLRGLAPFPTLAASIVAGLPLLALSRSARETTNFVVGAFGDFASAIAGVELDVHGERNLWLSRPCIFLFNHQSNADVFIVAKLVRRDVAGMAKQELRRVPLLGVLAEQGGLVFVDRGRTGDAARAMQPLVEALRRDGKSVCIAPEGTRSATGALGAFRKGAFHLAIATRAPVVPIVIHDSRDVQARGEIAMHPARVRVDVLGPIDTSGWRTATLGRHVADVRARFLEYLEPEVRAAAAASGPSRARARGER